MSEPSVTFSQDEETKSSVTGEMTSNVNEGTSSSERLCMRCGKAPATLSSDPCNHYECCNKCAMKMATGGKCKQCKQFYTSFQGLRPVSPPALGEKEG